MLGVTHDCTLEGEIARSPPPPPTTTPATSTCLRNVICPIDNDGHPTELFVLDRSIIFGKVSTTYP